MTWISTDSMGSTEHPSLSDEATPARNEHIKGCPVCAEYMPMQYAMLTGGIA